MSITCEVKVLTSCLLVIANYKNYVNDLWSKELKLNQDTYSYLLIC